MEKELASLSPEELAELEQILAQQQAQEQNAAVAETEALDAANATASVPVMSKGGPLGFLRRAALRSAQADNPYVAAASGWTTDENGNVVPGDPESEAAAATREQMFNLLDPGLTEAVQGNFKPLAFNAAMGVLPFAKVTKLGKVAGGSASIIAKTQQELANAKKVADAGKRAEQAAAAAKSVEEKLSKLQATNTRLLEMQGKAETALSNAVKKGTSATSKTSGLYQHNIDRSAARYDKLLSDIKTNEESILQAQKELKDANKASKLAEKEASKTAAKYGVAEAPKETAVAQSKPVESTTPAPSVEEAMEKAYTPQDGFWKSVYAGRNRGPWKTGFDIARTLLLPGNVEVRMYQANKAARAATGLPKYNGWQMAGAAGADVVRDGLVNMALWKPAGKALQEHVASPQVPVTDAPVSDFGTLNRYLNTREEGGNIYKKGGNNKSFGVLQSDINSFPIYGTKHLVVPRALGLFKQLPFPNALDEYGLIRIPEADFQQFTDTPGYAGATATPEVSVTGASGTSAAGVSGRSAVGATAQTSAAVPASPLAVTGIEEQNAAADAVQQAEETAKRERNAVEAFHNAYGYAPLSTAMQYAGPVTAGLLALHNVAQRPDRYTVRRPNPVVPRGQMDLIDPTFRPLDQNLLLQDALASGAGTVRALRNSGVGPATQAAIVAADNNIGRSLGDAGTKVWDANNQARNAVIAARNNNGIAQGQFDFNVNNNAARILNMADMQAINNELTQQRLNYAAEGQKYAAVQQQIDALADALAKIGRQNFVMNQLNSNSAFDYNTGLNGVNYYAPTFKCGGYIKPYKK